MKFLSELKRRNNLLYWFGWYNIIVGMVCFILIFLDNIEILGVSRWLKPMKFFFSVGIMSWTMGWLMYYLDNKKRVKTWSWIIVISMFIENFIIGMQSARGTVSHFNTTSALNGILFSVMGVFILIFTVIVILITWTFFRQKQFSISESYCWGIRIGLLLFLIFSIEGGMMVQRLSHTVGAPDGGPGLPVVNWSSQHGDLRIAHFLGMHALQIFPLAGFFVFRRKQQVIAFGILYFLIVSAVFVLALQGKPLLRY